MLRFKVIENGKPAKTMNLEAVHLLGTDRVPLRAEIKFAHGELICEPRARGAAAIALPWTIQGLGRMMLETARLPERPQPYNLHVELARGQLMRISQKREDWGLYDFVDGKPIYEMVDQAKELLVSAITAPDDAAAAELGDRAIAASVKVGEAISSFHADLFLKRRTAGEQIARRPLGCTVAAHGGHLPAAAARAAEAFDFAVVPFTWGLTEPNEGQYEADAIEACIQSLRDRKIAIWGAAMLSFEASNLPAWLPVLADDFEQVRDLAIRYVRYLVKRFGPHVRAWEVLSGVHAHNTCRFTFEQIMEITRTAAAIVKQMSPRCKAILGISLPWGEYYAQDPKTIPPLLYAEMAVESGVSFDAFGLDLRLGCPAGGGYARDLLQVSALLDRFGNLGKPLHVMATSVPSEATDAAYGCWHGDWSPQIQAQWVREFYRIALSKPFVETVTWHPLVDAPASPAATGLLTANLSPKPAFQEILSLRRDVLGLATSA